MIDWFFEHTGVGIVLILAVALIVQWVVIEKAYDGDYRCLVAECRIQKD